MGPVTSLDEELLRRLPLPLAQLLRRAHNAKTPAERHHAAFYVWEASLKLLGSMAIVEYAALPEHDTDLTQRLEAIARPSLGHWWEFSRRLLPYLSDAGDESIGKLRDALLKRSRDDLPRCAGLDAELLGHFEDRKTSKSTVRITELIDRIIRYRNTEIGHGAVGQRGNEFYGEMGNALFSAAIELLGKVDLLAGRRLIFVEDVRRHTSGEWMLERFDLCSETPRRMEPLLVSAEQSQALPRPGRSYLPSSLKGIDGASLHPLFLFEPETGLCYFLNSRRGRGKAEYLCYTTGDTVQRDSLAGEQRELLAKLLGVDVADASDTKDTHLEEDGSALAEADQEQRTIGEFELLSRLGKGGMGAVYRVWQPSLGRQIALKTLTRSGDPKAEARFAREIRALGAVDHPNLVKVFTSGSHGDKWFYTMELVDGADLDSICEQLGSAQLRSLTQMDWTHAIDSAFEQQLQAEKPLTEDKTKVRQSSPTIAAVRPPATTSPPGTRGYIERVVDTVRQVSSAAHALHQVGVIHRDIKPGNIMLATGSERAVLMDLGLAQIADEAEGRLTRTMQFVGTLRYASPEQILSVPLDARSDVYSLGATLWELLTLQPLFGATEQMLLPELMLKIQSHAPERPRQINPSVPADLEAIVMKCLEKDRAQRYESAKALAEDLQRWQRGEPVLAQPKSLFYLLRKSLRNHRGTITPMTAVVLLVLATISGLGMRSEFKRREAVRIQQSATASEAKALSALEVGEKEKTAAIAARKLAEQQLEVAKKKQTLAEQQSRIATAQRLASESQALGTQFPERRVLLALEAIKTTRSRHEPVIAAAENALRDALVNMGGLPLFDVEKGDEQGITALEMSADGRWLAASRRDHAILLCDLHATEPQQRLKVLTGHENFIKCLAISPDGHWLASAGADATARVWDLTAPDPAAKVRVLRGHEYLITCLAITPDSQFVITGGSDATARLWNLNTPNAKQETHLLTGHLSQVQCLAVSPDGHWLCTGSTDRTAHIWDLTAKDPSKAYQSLNGHEATINAVAITPDSHWLLTGSADTTARIWDLNASDPTTSVRTLRGHTDEISAIAVSPDNRWASTGSADSTARLWDLSVSDPNETVRVLKGHAEKVQCVAFNPNGRTLVTGSFDKTARVWDLQTDNPNEDVQVLRGQSGAITALEISPQGHWLMTASQDEIWENTARLWDLSEARVTATSRIIRGTDGEVYFLAISPDGRWLVTSNGGNSVWVWDLKSPNPAKSVRILRGPERYLTCLTISPNGRWLVSGGSDHAARVWDLSADDPEKSVQVLNGHEGTILCLTVTPDSRWLVTGSKDNTARVWDLIAENPGAAVRTLRGHQDSIWCLGVTHDGRWLCTGSQDQTARVWDLTAKSPAETVRVLEGHEGAISCLAIAPDGHWLCTGSNDSTARVWDLQSTDASVPAKILKGHQHQIVCLAISPDQRWLVTGSRDRTARIWDLQSDDPQSSVKILSGHEKPIRCLTITPDSQHVITGSDDTTARIWELTSDDPLWDVRILHGHKKKINAVVLDPDGHTVITGSSDRTARVWKLELEDLIADAKVHVGRTLSLNERVMYAVPRHDENTTTRPEKNSDQKRISLNLLSQSESHDP